MNTDRLLRDIDKRLRHLSEADRAEALDALREEIARDRRWAAAAAPVEIERERRLEAETLRDVLEAINRHGDLEQTIEEVLKQLSRIVRFDSCSVALVGPDGRFRVIAGRGFEDPSHVIGVTFKDPLSEIARHSTAPLSLSDVREDDRFAKVEGTADIRSWAGVPLLVEGEVIGLLSLDRHRVDPFDEEELHRAKAVAFSAAAAIRKAQLLEKVRRYAVLMERVVQVDRAVFAGREGGHIARLILEGAMRLGAHAGGMLVLDDAGGSPRVAAASPDLPIAPGASVPPLLAAREVARLDGARARELGAQAGLDLPATSLYLVPLATPDAHLGTLVLLDPDASSPDDRLLEAYAAHAAAAYFHATRKPRTTGGNE